MPDKRQRQIRSKSQTSYGGPYPSFVNHISTESFCSSSLARTLGGLQLLPAGRLRRRRTQSRTPSTSKINEPVNVHKLSTRRVRSSVSPTLYRQKARPVFCIKHLRGSCPEGSRQSCLPFTPFRHPDVRPTILHSKFEETCSYILRLA